MHERHPRQVFWAAPGITIAVLCVLVALTIGCCMCVRCCVRRCCCTAAAPKIHTAAAGPSWQPGRADSSGKVPLPKTVVGPYSPMGARPKAAKAMV
jgi:hypothetical protein